jgi:hypothetical protein
MKGIRGLIIAVGLGIAAALCNWSYLANQASQEKTVDFLGIKEGKTVNRGEALRDEDLVRLQIPSRWVGNLKDLAVAYDAAKSVVGQPVWRTMTGECMVLREDLKTPPEELKLEEGETALWIPVDTRTFVPSLVKPGDKVSFWIARPSGPTLAVRGGPTRTPSGESGEAAEEPFEVIGEFTILALGNRLGRADVMRAAKTPQFQENVLSIRVSDNVAGEKARAKKLLTMLQATNFRMVGVTLHSRKGE